MKTDSRHHQPHNRRNEAARSNIALEVPATNNPAKIQLFGLQLTDVTLKEAAVTAVTRARTGPKLQIFFVNAHCINIAAHNKLYNSILKNNEILYADGVGMAMAARICGQQLNNNVNGTDLFPLICDEAARHNIPIALLGSKPGIAETCAENMRKQFPDLRITWAHHGYSNNSDNLEIIQAINRSGARILLVGKGVPLQELWIAENSPDIDAPLILGVGALFDFYSGDIQRAPLFMRKLRLEWLFRLLIEPRRMFSRYIIGNPVFLLRAIKWRIARS